MRREPYPASLQAEVMHAVWFAHVLSVLAVRRGTTPTLSVWLTGRADEVTAFVGATLDDWSAKRVDAFEASDALKGYVAWLHHALRARIRKPVRLACCASDSGEHARPHPTPRDTLVDIEPNASRDPEDTMPTLPFRRVPRSA